MAAHIRTIRFNQEYDCFVCALEDGVRVYNAEPLVEKCRIDFGRCGSVAVVEMLHRTNLLALVGGGQAPKFPNTKVMIWDDSQSKFAYELLFRTAVLAVRMKRDRLMVVEESEVHLFSFPHPIEHQQVIATPCNPRGLFEVSSAPDRHILFYPGPSTDKFIGTVCHPLFIHPPACLPAQDVSPDPVISSYTIPAHQHALACIAVNAAGSLLATASDKGTLIRVRDVVKNEALAEFRRGADSALINCLTFSPDSHFLCASSDKGTVHIFAVVNQELNRKSTFAGTGISRWYTESQWGMAQVALARDTAFIAAFDHSRALHVACWDGSFFRYRFNPLASDGKFCTRESYDVFLDIGDDVL